MSFYIDETEVTNIMYLEYLDWIKAVFPQNEEKYKIDCNNKNHKSNFSKSSGERSGIQGFRTKCPTDLGTFALTLQKVAGRFCHFRSFPRKNM